MDNTNDLEFPQGWKDRLLRGSSFERLTRVNCQTCGGVGVTESPGHPAGKSACVACGGKGWIFHREPISVDDVRVASEGRFVLKEKE